MTDELIIRGAREHNLKNINLKLPRNKVIVFTGISGSGKSTLAFDTIFAEGQRRYLESLSSYARQFLGQMDKPDVDQIEGLSPAISIDQKSASHNPRSTVGTVTEIHDYLRLLYAKIGIPHCPICGREIKKLSTDEIVDRILELCEAGKKDCTVKIKIFSPVVRQRKGEYSSLLEEMFRRGFSKAIVNKKEIKLEAKMDGKVKLERYKKHDIDIVVDEAEINSENISRIFEGVEKALKLSGGIVKIVRSYPSDPSGHLPSDRRERKEKEFIFNQKLACPVHPVKYAEGVAAKPLFNRVNEIEFPELEPRLFSFNSPFGACPACEGLGTKKEIDPNLVAPDLNKTITQGGLMPWSYKKNNWQGTILRAVTNHFHIKDNVRLRDLSEDDFNILMHGKPKAENKNEELSYEYDYEDIPVTLRSKTGSTWKYNIEWRGVIGYLEDRYKKTDSEAVRTDIEKYMSNNPCSLCGGSRYKKEVMLVTIGDLPPHQKSEINCDDKSYKNKDDSVKQKNVKDFWCGGKNISEISQISVHEFLKFLNNLHLTERENIIAGRILKEIKNRTGFLENVGLGYLTLGRAANTLAGGETQRIRLAS